MAHQCVCGEIFQGWASLTAHVQDCVDWQAWEEHLEDGANAGVAP